jgi:uncharacterized protein YdcH (DUF465 family)
MSSEEMTRLEVIVKIRQAAHRLNKIADQLNELADNIKTDEDVYNENNLPSGLRQVLRESLDPNAGR